MGVNLPKGGTVTFSAYTIPFENSAFYLEDRQKGLITNLTKENYTVALPKSTLGTGRFYIHTTSLTTAEQVKQVNELIVRIWTSNQKVYIEGPVSHKATGAVFDMLGRKIFETQLGDERYNTFDVPSLLKGVYLVKITDGARMTVRKVVF